MAGKASFAGADKKAGSTKTATARKAEARSTSSGDARAQAARAKADTRPQMPRPAFPKRQQPPRPEAFAARLPLSQGKRLESVREFLTKHAGVTEDLHYYGPRTGWAFRYMRGAHPVCALMILGERPFGILGLDADQVATVDWAALSPAAQRAYRLAHGSPSLLWIDLPLDGTGAADFKILARTKIKLLPPPAPAARGPAPIA